MPRRLLACAILICLLLAGCAQQEDKAVTGVTLKSDMGIYVLIPDGWTYEQEEASIIITKSGALAKISREVGGSTDEARAYMQALAEEVGSEFNEERLYSEPFFYTDSEVDGVWTRTYVGYMTSKHNTFYMTFVGSRTDKELRAIEESILI